MTTFNVGTLVRAQQAKDRAAAAAGSPQGSRGSQQKVTTWRVHTLTVRRLTPNAIGVATGESEDVIDPRDGQPIRREKLIFLPRRSVAVVSGFLREGETIVLDVPSWLAERTGLDQVKGLVP